jgi:hypothetical protein
MVKILVFYSVQKTNEKIDIKRNKRIKLSCSTEADSICQLNDLYICIGLQDYDQDNQENGFAIIDIYKKEIFQIIEDLPVSSLYYNFEKKILISAMDLTDEDHTGIIKIFEFLNDDVELKLLYELESEHKDIIVSLAELKNINKDNNYSMRINDDNNQLIIATASLDCTLRIIQVENNI